MLCYFVAFHTTYNITVTPKTGGGYGPKAVIMVTTNEGPPSAPPTSIKLALVKAVEVLITWKPPISETLNGVLRSYIIEWRRISDGNVSNITLNGSQNSYNISNLKPFTEYKIRIAAQTVGKGPFSAWEIIKTNETSKNYLLYLQTSAEVDNFLPFTKLPV